jgi:glycine cleavage system aminomethyltransferase T
VKHSIHVCRTNDGGIVDDLLVYRLAEDMCNEGEQAFMLVVNASNMEKIGIGFHHIILLTQDL